jgi:hypothetical protein
VQHAIDYHQIKQRFSVVDSLEVTTSDCKVLLVVGGIDAILGKAYDLVDLVM